MDHAVRCCRGVSIKWLVLVVVFWGLIVGGQNFFNSLVRAITLIELSHHEGEWKMHEVYEAFEFLMFEYVVVLTIIFSLYLLYGTVRDFPEKSSYVCAWLLCGTVADSYALVDFIIHLIKRGLAMDGLVLFEQTILFTAQFMCLFVVYFYYRDLPRKKFTDT